MTIPSANDVQAQIDAAIKQEKDKRIKLAQAYMAQIEELRNHAGSGQHIESMFRTLNRKQGQWGWRRRSRGVRMKYQRMRELSQRSISILQTEGVTAFSNQMRLWLRGERRYHFSHHSKNQVSAARVPQEFPASRSPSTLNKFTVVYIVPTSEISSKRYLVYNVQEQLQTRDIETNWIDEDGFLSEPARALYFDIVVFARVPYRPEMAVFLDGARKLGIQVVFEIDDLIFDVSMQQYISGVSNLQEQMRKNEIATIAGYGEMMLRCDYFISTTEYIAEAARAWGKKTYVIRNGMNNRQLELAEQALQTKTPTPEVRIGYLSGSFTHQEDFAVAVPALIRILREFPQARLVVQGMLELPKELAAFESQIEKRPYVSWEQLVQDTARLDINLAPLEINPFTSGKSALKYFEAAIVEVPTIASPIEDFRIAIQPSETGFLATTDEEWYTYLRTLILDPELRARLGKNARQDALARYTPEAQSAHTLSVYQHILCGLDASAELPAESEAKYIGEKPLPTTPPAQPQTNRGLRFPESAIVHDYLDGLTGLEIGAAAHNPFGLQTKNVGLTRELDAEDFEFFKASQLEMCGEWARIDIPASAEDIPVPDNSQDFVLSSHVWEHLASPLLALEEWSRVVRPNGYILAIVPKRDAEPTDIGRPITPIEELIRHYKLRSTVASRKQEEKMANLHFTVFSPESLRAIAAWFNATHPSIQLLEVVFLETDDKVGNGHLILWQIAKTVDAAL